MTKSSLWFVVIFLIFNLTLLLSIVPSIQSVSHSGNQQCKELNQWNCYSAKNDGYSCSSNDQTKSETRWYYDKGSCRKFNYKGCNGNRNRFCTKEICMKRCEGE